MPIYEYKAIARASGKSSRGVIDAESPAQARQKLRDQDLYPTDLSEAAAGARPSRRRGGGGEEAASAGKGRSRGRVAPRDIALMTRQLAVLLRAGMPLVEALTAMLEQVDKPALHSALYDIRDKVNGGGQLGDAMSAHPRVFSNLYTNMVRAGEASGTLEQVLVRLADLQEHQSKLRSQVYSSLAYPVFMGIFAFGVVIFLMMVIVPRITMIFQKQDMELPQLTQVMIGASEIVGSYWWLAVLMIFGTFTLWRTWIGRPEGKKRWDRWKLRFPLYGGLHQKLVCARFARTLGTMLQSGLTMLPALDVVSKVLENAHVQTQMEDVKAGVRRGRDLAIPLKETGLFPPMMIHMIELGQRSGEIEDMLVKVADTYDEDVRLTIDALVGLMEPIIIIVMGLFVGVLVLSILLPIINMSSNLRH